MVCTSFITWNLTLEDPVYTYTFGDSKTFLWTILQNKFYKDISEDFKTLLNDKYRIKNPRKIFLSITFQSIELLESKMAERLNGYY